MLKRIQQKSQPEVLPKATVAKLVKLHYTPIKVAWGNIHLKPAALGATNANVTFCLTS